MPGGGGSADDDLVGAHKAQHIAGAFVQKIDVQIFVGQPVGQVAHFIDLGLPAVALLDQTYADFDQQAIRVVTRMDAGALNPEAVVKISKTA